MDNTNNIHDTLDKLGELQMVTKQVPFADYGIVVSDGLDLFTPLKI